MTVLTGETNCLSHPIDDVFIIQLAINVSGTSSKKRGGLNLCATVL